MLVIIEEKTRCYEFVLITNQHCAICSKKGGLRLNMMRRYNETFSIIRYPIEKFALIECNSCYHIIPENKWSGALKKLADNELESNNSKDTNFIWSWLWKLPLITIIGYLICWKLAVMIIDSY